MNYKLQLYSFTIMSSISRNTLFFFFCANLTIWCLFALVYRMPLDIFPNPYKIHILFRTLFRYAIAGFLHDRFLLNSLSVYYILRTCGIHLTNV